MKEAVAEAEKKKKKGKKRKKEVAREPEKLPCETRREKSPSQCPVAMLPGERHVRISLKMINWSLSVMSVGIKSCDMNDLFPGYKTERNGQIVNIQLHVLGIVSIFICTSYCLS